MKKLVKLVNIGNSARLGRGRAAQMSIGKLHKNKKGHFCPYAFAITKL